jgi:hypothetical protein
MDASPSVVADNAKRRSRMLLLLLLRLLMCLYTDVAVI